MTARTILVPHAIFKLRSCVSCHHPQLRHLQLSNRLIGHVVEGMKERQLVHLLGGGMDDLAAAEAYRGRRRA